MRAGSSQDAGHRPRVANATTTAPPTSAAAAATTTPSTAAAATPAVTATAGDQQQQPAAVAPSGGAVAHHTAPVSAPQPASNFEYDDNEWDIGIGDLIIDLDADIEKTNEVSGMATNAGPGGPQASKTQATAKMHIEHSATTADKGLKMKIKRTKPGTKTSEAKHEIVKSNEQTNGNVDQSELKATSPAAAAAQKPSGGGAPSLPAPNSSSSNKRSSSSHRRDKTRDKHTEKSMHGSSSSAPASDKTGPSQKPTNEINGVVRNANAPPQPGPPRAVFPASTGPGPPQGPPSTGPPPSPAAATAPGSAAKPEQAKGAAPQGQQAQVGQGNAVEDGNVSPPPNKKLKTDIKEVSDVCVGTSVGTITEPDCLGPCEPGTSVTLEGIVWHETEGGVLVVNVTWRGKTYVGTLLDCTRHDWAPPRFCDSPTSDLDNRTPKGRGKRGRSAATTTTTSTSLNPTDLLINFTETRSSVHSKLRNGGSGTGGTVGAGGAKGRRNGGPQAPPVPAPASPTPFVPPRPEPSGGKRKARTGEEDSPASNPVASQPKKSKVSVAASPVATPCTSPPPSPVLLECPEPNCSKKYKHINGLKYHQSHAHGSADDDDTKDVTSMSENDESNIEAPSPATPVKSPEKSQDSPLTPAAKKDGELPLLLRGLEVGSQPGTPRSTPPSPVTPPQSVTQEPPLGQSGVGSPTTIPLAVDATANVPKGQVVKPGVLRYTTNTASTPPEEYPVGGVFTAGNKPQVQGTPGPLPAATAGRQIPMAITPSTDQTPNQPESAAQPQSFSNQLPPQANPSQQFTQPPSIIIPNSQMNQQTQQSLSPHPPQSPNPSIKITQFKVKPTSALMPEEKKQQQQQQNGSKVQAFKKKNRKSPAGSPNPPQTEQPMFGSEQSGRDEVQSPAYSDISDDGAPVMEQEISDKGKNADKKTESSQSLPHMPQYGMYHPFYSQPHQYIMQQQAQQETKSKEPEKPSEKQVEKENKKDSEYPQKVLQQHYYPYGYMPGYPYNMESNYGGVPMVQDDKHKEDRVKKTPSPIDQTVNKQPTPIPNPIQVPTPKVKADAQHKDKHQNENHQILKESIEIKNQMNPYMYSRQSQQQQQQQQQQAAQPQQQQAHHNQRDEDVRRFYVYSEQRRKEQQNIPEHKSSSQSNKVSLPQSPNLKPKEIKLEEKKDKEVKQEGVKPTMETQGPPPPPTSQYAYIHPSYMQQHYGALPFDPNHPMYRVMVPGPYSGSPYLHAPIQRYHAPEDLSRAPPPSKTLDMLQHHAQYYSSHKIHELQERAIKSPTPKTSMASSSPSTTAGGGGGGGGVPPSAQQAAHVQSPATVGQGQPQQQTTRQEQGGKQGTTGAAQQGDKESRSPPPQRHVHTHHHTHVGLGYPMYPAPYGAAVLASQQAAAVTVINPYPTK